MRPKNPTTSRKYKVHSQAPYSRTLKHPPRALSLYLQRYQLSPKPSPRFSRKRPQIPKVSVLGTCALLSPRSNSWDCVPIPLTGLPVPTRRAYAACLCPLTGMLHAYGLCSLTPACPCPCAYARVPMPNMVFKAYRQESVKGGFSQG